MKKLVWSISKTNAGYKAKARCNGETWVLTYPATWSLEDVLTDVEETTFAAGRVPQWRNTKAMRTLMKRANLNSDLQYIAVASDRFAS